jgi:photosystem II stability/assembly factor-like uncharacterized protein
LATRPRTLALLLAGLVGIAWAGSSGCDSSAPTAPPLLLDSIYIVSPSDTLVVLQSVQLTYAAFDTAGASVPSATLAWSSSAPSIASVDSRGRVTGVGEGMAVITAAGGGAVSNPETLVVLQGFGWVSQENGVPTVNNLNGVHFVDRMRGWAVGELGTLIATQNAGQIWMHQVSNSTSYRLNAVHFLSPDSGFVVGSAGRMIVTTDGGRMWNPKTVDAGGQELTDVYFVNSAVGFAVGAGGVILRTQDAGATWVRYVPSVTTQNLRSVWAVIESDTIYAWACGDVGSIVGTRDGGDTWTIPPSTVASDPMRAVVRRSLDEAIMVGLNNRVGLTLPGPQGPHWEPLGNPAEFGNFHGLAWPVAGRAYLAGINQSAIASLQVSTDGGFTWAIQPLPGTAPLSNNELRCVWFVDADYGWAVGRGGLVLHTATGGF